MSRAWRAQWKDQPVDMSYSFVFSMTAIGVGDKLKSLLYETRKIVLEQATSAELVEMVERSRRCGPIIGDLGLRTLLHNRIDGWGSQ